MDINAGNPIMATLRQYTSISKVACLRWVYLGLFLLSWSLTGKAFELRYFNFYNETTVFSAYSAAISLIGLFVSSIFYAQLADRLQPRFTKIKSYIITFQILMGAIFDFLIYGFFVNFWLAAGLFGLKAIICGGISPPMLAIMASAAPKGTQGSAISLWVIVSSLAYLASVTLLGKFLPQDSTLSHV